MLVKVTCRVDIDREVMEESHVMKYTLIIANVNYFWSQLYAR